MNSGHRGVDVYRRARLVGSIAQIDHAYHGGEQLFQENDHLNFSIKGANSCLMFLFQGLNNTSRPLEVTGGHYRDLKSLLYRFNTDNSLIITRLAISGLGIVSIGVLN